MFAASLLALSSLTSVSSHVLPRSDVSTLPGSFTLVTTQSTTFPVVSTGNLALYYGYHDETSPGLNLFSQNSFAGTALNLTAGVLGTYRVPDDVVGDGLPWNATTPSSGGFVTFEDQYAAHAG
jgi:hypothetical protein